MNELLVDDAVFVFEDSEQKMDFSVSLSTLLECLELAEKNHVVPPVFPEVGHDHA